MTGVGAGIGGLIGLTGGFLGFIIGFGLGGSLNIALKSIGRFIKGLMSSSFEMMMGAFFMMLLSPLATVKKIASISWQMKKAADVLASDAQTLEAMRDYFAYTQAMEKAADTKGFDALTAEGGELFNNSYARNVKANGEKAAQAELRRGVVQIAANGEIIRSFDPLTA